MATANPTYFAVSTYRFTHSLYPLLLPLRSIGHAWNALLHFSFLILRQSIGLLGRGISPSQGCYLHKHGIESDIHSCFEWDSNPRSQCSSERTQLMPYTAWPLWSAPTDSLQCKPWAYFSKFPKRGCLGYSVIIVIISLWFILRQCQYLDGREDRWMVSWRATGRYYCSICMKGVKKAKIYVMSRTQD
jgi:hypothetical protein